MLRLGSKQNAVGDETDSRRRADAWVHAGIECDVGARERARAGIQPFGEGRRE